MQSVYQQCSGPRNRIAAIAAHNNFSIGLTVTKVAIATTSATSAIASATTKRRWAPRATVLIWLITPMPDALSNVWCADTCSLILSATASACEWASCCTSRSVLESSSLPLAHCGNDQVAIELTRTRLRCSWGIYRVGRGLIPCATRVVPNHVDHVSGNIQLNVTLMHPSYRPSDNSLSSAVGIRIHSAVSCRPRHGVARSSVMTTRLRSIFPLAYHASCSRHSLNLSLF